jgi:Protein of unknown function (DUF1501)
MVVPNSTRFLLLPVLGSNASKGQTDAQEGIAFFEKRIRPLVDKVHMHDLHATILYLLGLDHEKLTYRFDGRDFRLTDVHGHVVKQIIG